MDGSRCAAWTRRRLVAVAGGGAGAAVALAALGESGAKSKRRRRRKRCRKIREMCHPGGRRCCHQRTCGGPPASRFCCKQGGEPCGGNGDCCNLMCFEGLCALN